MVKPGSEELRRNVFSSIHMSTKLRSSNASVSYPCCTFCGGASNKGSPKRKVLLCTLSLYVNPSESFVVWGKKQDDPKGMLWLRSCCVRRGQERMIELISRGCRGRCSYTLKFSSAHAADDWYRALRGESRRAPTVGDDVFTEEDDERMTATLDAILTEMTPSASENYLEEGEEVNNGDEGDLQPPFITVSPAPPASLPSTLTAKTSKSRKWLRKKRGPSPVLCSPFAGLVSRKSSCPISSSSSILPLESIENTSPVSEEIARWSWPQSFS